MVLYYIRVIHCQKIQETGRFNAKKAGVTTDLNIIRPLKEISYLIEKGVYKTLN